MKLYSAPGTCWLAPSIALREASFDFLLGVFGDADSLVSARSTAS